MRDELILKERNSGMDTQSPIIDDEPAEDVIVPDAPASDPTAAE